MTNKDDNFYTYMGKLFGSRIAQTETKDRIYDDNNKIWYIYLNPDNKPCAYVSICDCIIKNVYTTNNDSLKELLLFIKSNIDIKNSIVTKVYQDIYLDCGFKVDVLDNYKNFVVIRGE